jgi:23S rRNA (pseudouridine1915-N3)-methyltransferase
LRLLAIGKLREPESSLFARYAARLRPGLDVRELADGAGAAAEAKRRENAALRAALGANDFAVALDPGGPAPDSEGFAALLRRWQGQQAPLCFLIGGAEGLDGATLARANAHLGLGPMIWPHLLARVMLAEQLFRAQSITAGHPYHRAGRPAG